MTRVPFRATLALLTLAGLAVRLAIIAGPLGELDADEAVVGLMARHIAFEGARPVFYYNQQYLGSLEAFTAASFFQLFNSSTVLLKLVPTAYSLGFLVLSALLARRLFGRGPALITAAYLALPPSMWAVWSTKARGGYAEVLFLGEAVLLVTLWLAAARRPLWGWLLLGLLAGLAFWTHLLAIVYLVAAAIYLLAVYRRALRPTEVGVALVGAVLGALPMVTYNVQNGLPTVAALLQPADLPLDPLNQLIRFFRIGLPVLGGLGQPTTSSRMFDLDWGNRPAGRLPVAIGFVLLLGAVLLLHAGSLRRLVGRVAPTPSAAGPALLVLVALLVPPIISLTRFGFFVSEPRYALPLYSAIPLLAAALWRLPAPARVAGSAALLMLNASSVLSTDPRLWRPEESVQSTRATRAELVRALESEDRHQVYTDYWIAYPVIFETREHVLAYVISGGFNRYVPYADNVQRTPNAAWVVIPGSEAERGFLARAGQVNATYATHEVSVYRVFENIEPLDAVRPR